MTDDHHDNSYEDTGEITSIRAHIAYADWRGPDFDPQYQPMSKPDLDNYSGFAR